MGATQHLRITFSPLTILAHGSSSMLANSFPLKACAWHMFTDWLDPHTQMAVLSDVDITWSPTSLFKTKQRICKVCSNHKTPHFCLVCLAWSARQLSRQPAQSHSGGPQEEDRESHGVQEHC